MHSNGKSLHTSLCGHRKTGNHVGVGTDPYAYCPMTPFTSLGLKRTLVDLQVWKL